MSSLSLSISAIPRCPQPSGPLKKSCCTLHGSISFRKRRKRPEAFSFDVRGYRSPVSSVSRSQSQIPCWFHSVWSCGCTASGNLTTACIQPPCILIGLQLFLVFSFFLWIDDAFSICFLENP
jgi:hypothetical protein